MISNTKPEGVFGKQAAIHWRKAWDHLHRFASLSGAIPGDDVIRHFLAQQRKYEREIERKK